VSNDTGLIEKVAREAISANPRAVNDFKSGKEKAIMALFGACMKQLKGNCDPNVLKEIVVAEINKI
jgi:aspartyl-tRNA(Asn)/glutamyl-tRNA(Gln) amidotransferase subunit B